MANFRSRREFHESVLSGNEEAHLTFYANKSRLPLLGGEGFTTGVRQAQEIALSEEHVLYETGILRPLVSSVIGGATR